MKLFLFLFLSLSTISSVVVVISAWAPVRQRQKVVLSSIRTIKSNTDHRNPSQPSLLQLYQSSSADDTTTSSSPPDIPDYTGKTIYQRTFYRLSKSSQVAVPSVIMLEERLRFRPDPNNKEYVLPFGPRTFILREGTDQDALTDALFTIDLLPSNGQNAHNGPRSMDTEIATILYLASNPQWIQGDILELSCSGTAGASGIVGLLGCIAAKFATMSKEELTRHKQQLTQTESQQDIVDGVMTVPKHESSLFPRRMHRLTLSDESPEALQGAFELIKKHSTANQVSIKPLQWSVPRRISNNRRYDHEYRTIVGSDLELSFPTAKELARTVANMLLPSNEFAVANIKEGANTAPSFGALGMDPEPSPTSYQERYDEEVDPSIPPTFIHLCPDYRDEATYLRQFLEKGFRMSVRTAYVKMQRLQFVFQPMEEGTPERELEQLDSLELQEETSRDYQSLTAVHHPDYAGDGSGEYFFPLETGAYEGGLSNTYYDSNSMEPEEGGYSL
ncbi:hypothetical protein IV203_002150 [Nitzschia inconspicua]|uniref:Uncharacterized protein n=1 Tax=Nitzschia inconspicua TaxID=303405 RepID=A0A9K3PRY9_9STRA|nr:hypothetical protein IV203_002150 [Nitzschia inconspicua]